MMMEWLNIAVFPSLTLVVVLLGKDGCARGDDEGNGTPDADPIACTTPGVIHLLAGNGIIVPSCANEAVAWSVIGLIGAQCEGYFGAESAVLVGHRLRQIDGEEHDRSQDEQNSQQSNRCVNDSPAEAAEAVQAQQDGHTQRDSAAESGN